MVGSPSRLFVLSSLFLTPAALAAGTTYAPGDVLFQTSITTNRLGIYSFSQQAPIAIPSAFDQSAFGITADPFGHVYIAGLASTRNTPDRIARVNLLTGESTILPNAIELGEQTGAVGIAYEPRGTLITSGQNRDRLIRINPANGLSETFVTAPTGSTHQGAAVDSQGRIYTLERAPGVNPVYSLVRFHPETAQRTVLRTMNDLVVPDQLAVHPNGSEVFITARGQNLIFRASTISASLQLITAIVSPMGVAFGSNNRLFVAGFRNNVLGVQSLNLNNNTAETLFTELIGGGRPYGLAVVPVPGSGTAALAGLGLLTLARRRRY